MRFSVSKAGLFYSPPIFEMQIYKKILIHTQAKLNINTNLT